MQPVVGIDVAKGISVIQAFIDRKTLQEDGEPSAWGERL